MRPETDPRSSETGQQGSIPVDLEPMYQLEEGQYIHIINRLSNLLLVTVRSLRDHGVPELAGELSQSASTILADYDPDVADVIGRAAHPPYPR